MLILREVSRWRICLGRHICIICGFSGQRATDRRLKKLIDTSFLSRKKVIYGIPYIYSLTNKSKILLSIPQKTEKIKLEQIVHDITVLDTVIYFMYKMKIELDKITSEKQLHKIDGFSNRTHRPDFIFEWNNKIYCIEVELNLKTKAIFEKNIYNNFMNYDIQIWIVPKSKNKIMEILKENSVNYPTIEIIELEEVQKYVKSI